MRRAQHRLDEAVREAEHEDVLHGLLAEEVVDPEDLRFAPARVELLVERDRGPEVGTERLLDHEPPPPLRLLGEPRGGDLLRGVGEHAGRKREVEDGRAVEHVLQPAQRLDRDVTAVERDPVDEPVDLLGVDITDVRCHLLAEEVVVLAGAPLLARVPDDAQVIEPLTHLEREERGEEQPRREVA
jgi:hypothetical protein